jgi:hypothetical protein
VGLVLLAYGGWRVDRTFDAHNLCHTFGDLQSVAGGLTGNALAHPRCGGVDRPYYLAWLWVGIAAVVAIVGLTMLYRRARASRRAGLPWWPTRSAERVSAWIDAKGREPRAPDRSPRVRPNVVMAVALLLVLGVLEVGNVARQDVQRSIDRHRLHRGEAALAALTFPAGLTAGDNPVCHDSIDTRCAASGLSPDAVAPILESLLDGKPDTALCDILPPPAGAPCEIGGTVGGYHALAFAFPEVHFGADRSQRVAGTNVTIDLLKASSETHVG